MTKRASTALQNESIILPRRCGVEEAGGIDHRRPHSESKAIAAPVRKPERRIRLYQKFQVAPALTDQVSSCSPPKLCFTVDQRRESLPVSQVMPKTASHQVSSPETE